MNYMKQIMIAMGKNSFKEFMELLSNDWDAWRFSANQSNEWTRKE